MKANTVTNTHHLMLFVHISIKIVVEIERCQNVFSISLQLYVLVYWLSTDVMFVQNYQSQYPMKFIFNSNSSGQNILRMKFYYRWSSRGCSLVSCRTKLVHVVGNTFDNTDDQMIVCFLNTLDAWIIWFDGVIIYWTVALVYSNSLCVVV